MKERVDKMWKLPMQTKLYFLKDYDLAEKETFEALYQHQEALITHLILHQPLDQLRRDQQSFLNKLVNQLKLFQQGEAPVAEVQRQPMMHEIFEQLVGLSKWLKTMELNQLQTCQAAASNQEDF
ncbi:hypothetical protein H1R20_g13590, partial [Candolleomyces eurysporus]